MVKAIIVVDLGFGDSGKGTITDALVRQTDAAWVVRFNGGAQAGHAVVTGDGREHIFSQFGAGTFVPGVRTYLSRFMVLHPGGLLREAEVLEKKGVEEPLSRVVIDPGAKVITPFHQAANRLREILRGDSRHGSCGLGVGETMHHSLEHPEEAVVAGDLSHPDRLFRKLCRVQQRYYDEFRIRRKELEAQQLAIPELAILEGADALERFLLEAQIVSSRVGLQGPTDGWVVFEGAQGVLLDEWRGFHPYTTWSTCTFDNALELVREWGGEAHRLGVVRSYATRHGAGPFPTEQKQLQLPELHNRWGPWQEGFRNGWLDLPLLRYAKRVCGGLDGLAVTHLDRISDGWKVAERYRELEEVAPGRFRDLDYQAHLTHQLESVSPIYREVAGAAGLLSFLSELAPVWVESWGATAEDKRILAPGILPQKDKAAVGS